MRLAAATSVAMAAAILVVTFATSLAAHVATAVATSDSTYADSRAAHRMVLMTCVCVHALLRLLVLFTCGFCFLSAHL